MKRKKWDHETKKLKKEWTKKGKKGEDEKDEEERKEQKGEDEEDEEEEGHIRLAWRIEDSASTRTPHSSCPS